MPPPLQRPDALARLSDARFDVLIVGGGIVGAGIARDAAMRGLRTALVEQSDFAALNCPFKSSFQIRAAATLRRGPPPLCWKD